jgi:RNA polymerase sigma-70 factor, ECF subfamily
MDVLLTNPSHLSLDMKSDEVLAKEAKHRSAAFAELYQRNLNVVYRYHLARVGNIHDAQDLTAETFLAAQEAIASFSGRGQFAAWLMGIARRKTANFFRRKRSILPLEAAEQLVDDAIAPEEFAERQLSLEQITQALSYLSYDRAEAISLQLFSGLSVPETAKVMGKSEGAVKMLVSRALKDLRIHLDSLSEEKL